MTFKVIGQLTNVRPPKDESPLLVTTPSKGIIKITAAAAAIMGVSLGDHVTIINAETDNGVGFFLRQIPTVAEGESQNGSKLSASTSGVAGGTLQFSSENAWRQLGGNKENRKVYSVSATPVEDEGVKYFPISYERDEAKQVRESKGEGEASTEE